MGGKREGKAGGQRPERPEGVGEGSRAGAERGRDQRNGTNGREAGGGGMGHCPMFTGSLSPAERMVHSERSCCHGGHSVMVEMSNKYFPESVFGSGYKKFGCSGAETPSGQLSTTHGCHK